MQHGLAWSKTADPPLMLGIEAKQAHTRGCDGSVDRSSFQHNLVIWALRPLRKTGVKAYDH